MYVYAHVLTFLFQHKVKSRLVELHHQSLITTKRSFTPSVEEAGASLPRLLRHHPPHPGVFLVSLMSFPCVFLRLIG